MNNILLKTVMNDLSISGRAVTENSFVIGNFVSSKIGKVKSTIE